MPCQSGVNAVVLSGVLAAPLAHAGTVDWAHQTGSLQSNGAITVKTLSGGSYTGTQNPTGAVAKVNQNAVTQPPTVIIQATSSSTPILMMTANGYNGNLGGTAGADAKCVAEFGTGWKFAEIGKVQNGVLPTGVMKVWFHTADGGANNNCNGWTDGTSAHSGVAYQGNYSSPSWSANGVSPGCNNIFRLACINY